MGQEASDRNHNKLPENVRREVARREKLLAKFQGSLVGGAAGDALGYAVEFVPDAEIREKYGTSGIAEYDLDDAGVARFSDNTQMTLFTVNGLLVGDTRGCLRGIGGPYFSYCTHTYRDWLHTQDRSFEPSGDSWLLSVDGLHARRAPGSTCMSAIRKGFGSIDEPANNSKGCGGVMRVAPIGLHWANYRYRNGEDLLDFVVREAAECAALTHGHPHAAAYQAELLQRACDLAKSPEWSCRNIARIGLGWVGEEAFAIGVYACMRHANDFGAALRVAVNHDGDSDSTGSICGNIMGTPLINDALRGIERKASN